MANPFSQQNKPGSEDFCEVSTIDIVAALLWQEHIPHTIVGRHIFIAEVNAAHPVTIWGRDEFHSNIRPDEFGVQAGTFNRMKAIIRLGDPSWADRLLVACRSDYTGWDI